MCSPESVILLTMHKRPGVSSFLFCSSVQSIEPLPLNCVCFQVNMTADNEIDIKEAFQRAQKGHNNKAKLVASLRSRYVKVRSTLELLLCGFETVGK